MNPERDPDNNEKDSNSDGDTLDDKNSDENESSEEEKDEDTEELDETETNLETTEHDRDNCFDPDCKLCEPLEEEDRQKRKERNEKRKNCLARRTKKYLRDFDKWSKEDIEKMEEKFEKYLSRSPGRLEFARLYHSIQFDNNLNEKEYWFKRHDNECQKLAHEDPNGEKWLRDKIYDYIELVTHDFCPIMKTCDCSVEYWTVMPR